MLKLQNRSARLGLVALMAVAVGLVAGCGADPVDIPPYDPERHVLGPADAPVTVMTFDDFQ